MITLTGPTQLLVTIDPQKYVATKRTHRGLDYLLDRLFAGEEVSEREFETWGITVHEACELVDVGTLRAVDEDDVELALAEGCNVGLPLTAPDEVVEAFNCILDGKLGVAEEDRAAGGFVRIPRLDEG